MNDERDFYEDTKFPTGEIIGYCSYDKSEIYDGDPYVIFEGQMYHKENFILLNTNIEEGINDE